MKLSKYAKQLGICYRTAWRHFKSGNIQGAYQLPSGTIIVPDQVQLTPKQDKGVCVYARASSSQNRDNLESQAKRLEDYCIARGWKISRVVKETASGINDKRKLLSGILGKINDYDLVVVEHRDRLTRMGFNYLDSLCPGKFHVVNETEDKTEDLANDLVAIITSFCARLYGQRRGKRKTERIIRELRRE